MTARALLSNLFFIALAGVLLVGGCGGSSSPGADTNTYFLADCANGCPGDLICACGLCTLLCDDNSSCARLSEQARCRPLTNGNCSVKESVCDQPCGETADCEALDPSDSCVEGACR